MNPALLLIISSVYSINYHHNEKISIDFDFQNPVPSGISKYHVFDVFDPYDNYVAKEKSHKIGNVYVDGSILYEDSDTLDYRIVSRRHRDSDADIVRIYSVYLKCGEENREVVEFKREPDSQYFVEIVRVPLTLDLKSDREVNYNILAYRLIFESRKYFRIRRRERFRYMIGVVKYGDLVIDDTIHSITEKDVSRFLEGDRIRVNIAKRTRDGHIVYTQYVLTNLEGEVSKTKTNEEMNKIF